MARTNKYTSINFNDIFEKKSNPKSSSSSSSSPLTSAPSSSSTLHKTHGGMLVLTRPTPKPLLPQNPKPLAQSSHPAPSLHRSRSEPDSSNPISLRPLGRTGSSSLPQEREREAPAPAPAPASAPVSLKPEPFVPPHLRPGFVGKEEKFAVRSIETGLSNGFNENGRPKSVGGYERMRRGGESDDGGRPGSSGGRRPGSGGGRYGSSYSSTRK